MNQNKLQLDKNKEKDDLKTSEKKSQNKIFTKKNIFFFFIPLIIFVNIYLINNNPKILELNKKIEELESKIQKMEKKTDKKVKIAFVSKHIYLNGIARFIIVLGELLSKTGKYEVHLINEIESKDLDFHYYKKIKNKKTYSKKIYSIYEGF